jgi:TonB family protein
MASVAGEKSSPARREKFGKFVLLEQVDAASIGIEYRAAKLGSAGLEKIVDLIRLSQVLSANADAAKTLMDQAKFAAQLQNPNVLKIFGIGKVEGSYYISYEFIEGKSLKTIFGRCRSEGFPFSVDHALLIASKICSALEYAHSRKLDGGGRYYHGLTTPGNVVVSYEGEVRVRGFGYWPSKVRELGLVGDDEIVYIAPEQAAGGNGDPRSDTFAVGAILFEALTGQPLLLPDRKQDIPLRVQNARLQGPSGDEDALPKQIGDILLKALAADPGGRYNEIQEMRKAIDTLLFSGDFTPTTFNLAFFMHSLFREDIERESKVLKEEKEASYFEFLEDVKKTPLPSDVPSLAASMPAPAPAPAPAPVPAPAPTPRASSGSLPLIPPPSRDEPLPRMAPIAQPTPVPTPVHREPVHLTSTPAPISSGLSAKEAAAGLTFHKEEEKSKGPMIAIAAVALIALGVGGFFMMRGKSEPEVPVAVATPAPTVRTPSPEEVAAQEKLRALEAQLAEMKAAQERASQEAADKARRKLEDDARRNKQVVSAEELARAETAARQKAEEDERRRQAEQQRELEERRRLAERAEQEAKARAEAEAKARAEEAARLAAAAATTAPAATASSSSAVPSDPGTVKVGDIVNSDAPDLIPPQRIGEPRVTYPSKAQNAKVEGDVIVNALVDENGKVTETRLIKKITHPLGQDCNTVALASVKRMEYRPATKNGVRVKVWVTVKIPFHLPR